ncbi:MAG: hypothetical protein GY789_06165 [Hyphomicrobiales bacterium]|nr:hypothetical protein [Hyphomicrobiales bacterium]
MSLRIFGGNNSFTLAADRMIATFTNVPVHQTDFVNSIILQAYQACLDEFVEIEISSIRSDANYHFEMTGKVSASDILKVDKSNKLIERARSVSSIVVEPAIRFQIVDKDGRWNCKVTSEKSELVDAGLFLERIILVNDLTDIEAPVKQFELISRIEKMIEEFLKLTLVEESTHEN